MSQGPSERFTTVGIDLNRPIDDIKPNHYPYLQNLRITTQGQLEPRFGLSDLGIVVAAQTPLHSIRRLNDPSAGLYTYILGAGTHLAYGVSGGPYTDVDSGYSGNPLALMPYRPESATGAYMYCADSSRMRKLSRAGVLDTIGYAPPTTAPSVALTNAPSYKVIDEFDATTGWGQAGTAGAPTLISRTPGGASGATTTIANIVYDSSTTGWACVNLTSMVGAGVGERLTFATAPETVTVQAVFPVSVATTISRIIYDSGTSGMCSLVLATPIEQVAVDALINNATVGPENARVVAVVNGPAGTTSLRVSTTNTWAATNTVQLLASVRCYLANNHAAAENVSTDAMRSAITSGTGTLTKTAAMDLSLLATGVPVRPDDYMHIALRVDRPDLISELKVQLDVDSATNDFTRNFYTRSFRASDITPAIRNLQSTIAVRATALQREIIDSPSQSANPPDNTDLTDQQVVQDPWTGAITTDPTENTDANNTTAGSAVVVSQQLESGDVQWVDLMFHISELTRVGTDDTRTLANVATIRIVAIVTGNVTLDMDSWWIGGGYGPDTGDPTTSPYLYRYRVRNLATNAASNFSPATRLELNPYRQSITVTPTQYAAPSGTSLTAATSLVLDIERFGGLLPSWHYVGTTANAASPSFTDTFPDDTVATQPTLANDNFQPWPLIQVPATGTTAANGVAGTTINDVGTNFNASWAPGTLIKINGVVNTIYRVISTARLELVENAGSQTSVTWAIDEPLLQGQPLPCLWGDEEFGAAFACGDTSNPGRLYFTNPFNPDSTQEKLYLDITSPSEPLMNGLIWNGRSYVYSSERCFQILATGNADIPYRVEEVPGTGGVFSRWGLVRNPTAPFMATLGKDGINKNIGGVAESLTDDDLYPLFPNEGNIGTLTNSVSPPNMVLAQVANLRMEFYDNYLYFDYKGVSGLFRTLAYNLATGGWFPDIYTPEIQMRYGEEGLGVHGLLCGGIDGHLYRYTGTSDAGSDISCVFETPSRDQGAPRIQKYYEDCMLDVNPGGVTITITPGVNNRSTNYTSITTAAVTRTQVTVPLGTAAQTARNIALRVNFFFNGTNPVFYLWETRWAPETAPLAALRWSTSPQHFGMANYKHIGEAKVTHVSDDDLSLVVTVDGVAQAALTIPASSGIYAETYFRVPVYKGKLYAFDLTSVSDFRIAPNETWFMIGEWDRADAAYQKVPVFSQS